MELSPSDIRGMLSGLVAMVIVLFLANAAATFLSIDLWQFIVRINAVTSVAVALFVYAVIISAANFILSVAILNMYAIARHHTLANPFY